MALLRSWAWLPAHVREVATAKCREMWVAVASRVSTDADAAVRLAIAEIAGLAGDPALVPSVGRLLNDPSPEVARAADRSFAALLRDQSVQTPGAPAEIERSFADALRASGTVRATDVAKAVASLMDRAAMANPESPLAMFLNDPEADLTPIQATLRRARDPVTRQRAWEWLGRSRLAPACVDALANARTPEDHARVVGLWHLIGNPARARRLRLVRVRAGKPATSAEGELGPKAALPRNAPCPAPADLAALPIDARRGFPCYLAGLDADGPSRVLLSERYLAEPDALARLAAVTHGSSRVLGDFCFDADPCVSRSAALRRSNLGAARASKPAAARLERAAHAWVRRVHEEDAPALLADTPACRVLWRKRLALDRERVLADLRSAILGTAALDATNGAEHASSARTGAIMLARRLGLGALLREALVEVAAGAALDARAAASAVAALGQLPGAENQRLLIDFASHADERVRANAVEGLGLALRAGSVEIVAERLHEMKTDPNHRVRANALRPLVLESSDHVAELCRMMRDPRVGHRLAGSWLASRLVTGEHAASLGRRGHDLLVEIKRCAEDSEAAVRRRAGHALAMIGGPGEVRL